VSGQHRLARGGSAHPGCVHRAATWSCRCRRPQVPGAQHGRSRRAGRLGAAGRVVGLCSAQRGVGRRQRMGAGARPRTQRRPARAQRFVFV
ncbi:MAG: hypothetical protein AVDCRST_MAG53-1316, partial [uncultured Solirubrobacteraceae bacterium]